MRAISLLLFACATTLAVRADEFDTANHFFDQEKFSEAKQRYEQLVAEGKWTANLFYNLGNADFRLGAPGVAALNYERALALEPSHPEAAMNLRLLREQTGARIFPPSWRDHLVPPLAIDVCAVIGASAAWLALFCVIAIIVRRGAISPNVWLLLALFVVLAAYAGFAVWHHAQDASLAVITARQAEARLAPVDRAARAETLPAGSRVRVVSERGDWIYCALPGGGLGWLPASALEKVRLRTS
jgi:tetratricopeptide (TPR) repeat protein